MPDFNVSNSDNIETIPADNIALAKVRIFNLRKRYPDGNLAVRDFSLSMLEGQITCLLGHNGAG
jgi:ABC-type sugar transport system ATPase subunit